MSSLPKLQLPLSPELHERLQEEAKRSGQPETAVVHHALESWLSQQDRQRRHDEIAAWAAQHAGSELDLDRGLEHAGLEVFAAEPST